MVSSDGKICPVSHIHMPVKTVGRDNVKPPASPGYGQLDKVFLCIGFFACVYRVFHKVSYDTAQIHIGNIQVF